MSVMKQRPDQSVIQEVALATDIAESFVEKDWFVTQAIRAVAEIKHSGFDVVFSGGTALSKAHGLLQRFSEDIDFRVVAENSDAGRKALSNYKHAVVDALRQQGFEIDDAQVRARDGNRFFAIDLSYESYFTRAGALRPHVQIEFAVRDIKTSMSHDDRRSKNNQTFSGLPIEEKFGQMLSAFDNDKNYWQEYDQFVRGVSYAQSAPDFDVAMRAVRDLVAVVIKA